MSIEEEEMDTYLESSEFIDWKTPSVFDKAKELAAGISAPQDVAQKCFEFVREEIKHSGDFRLIR